MRIRTQSTSMGDQRGPSRVRRSLPGLRREFLRIKTARSMKIQNQQVNPLIQKLGRFHHERTPRPATRLIARRNNFRKGNNTIVAHMMHGNDILLAAVIRHVGFGVSATRGLATIKPPSR